MIDSTVPLPADTDNNLLRKILTILNTGGGGGGGIGTVTSVGLSLPSIFTVSGSPVSTSGTLTAVLASQSAGLFLASPAGSSGAPTMRALTIADLSGTTAAISSFGFAFDGGGSVLTTGSKGQIAIPYACTINSWYVYNKSGAAGLTGSIVVDVKRSGTSIIGAGNKPTMSSAQSATAAAASWTSVTVAAGDILEFNVDSVSTFTWVGGVFKVTKT